MLIERKSHLYLLKSDFAIISGGTLTFEMAYYGLPSLVVSLAINQVEQAKAWQEIVLQYI